MYLVWYEVSVWFLLGTIPTNYLAMLVKKINEKMCRTKVDSQPIWVYWINAEHITFQLFQNQYHIEHVVLYFYVTFTKISTRAIDNLHFIAVVWCKTRVLVYFQWALCFIGFFYWLNIWHIKKIPNSDAVMRSKTECFSKIILTISKKCYFLGFVYPISNRASYVKPGSSLPQCFFLFFFLFSLIISVD